MLVQLFSNFTMNGLRHAISIYQMFQKNFQNASTVLGATTTTLVSIKVWKLAFW